jgi:hypothetical protein
VKGNVATDIPASRIAALAGEVQDADLAGLERHVLTPAEGYVTVDASTAAGYVLYPNVEAIRSLVDDIVAPELSSTEDG